MAADGGTPSFIKDLATSDRPTRDKALESLRLFLTSGRAFTYLELLKIWKGIFYCMHHTANPLPQQRLSKSLASLLLDLPQHVFIPFLAAFFQTMVSYWSSIPSLRLDKYLFLIRLYMSHSFTYLSKTSWSTTLLKSWTALMTGDGECQGILDAADQKVGDGLRYHVLDVWVDGLIDTEEWSQGIDQGIMKPIVNLSHAGATKTLRSRAENVVHDKRLSTAIPANGRDETAELNLDKDAEDFGGFDD